MTEVIAFTKIRDIYNKSFIDVIEKSFDCLLDFGDNSISITSESNLNILRATEFFSSLELIKDIKDIDLSTIEYLCELCIEGGIKDFLSREDEIVYTTPVGRPIKAKTLGQRLYIDALLKSDLTICSGPAGSGKTFLGVAMAVKALRDREVSRLILTRPALEAGERLGFLPGDIEEKVNPYMRPIYDALGILLGADLIEKYFDKGLIEVSPLAFMRGRNLDDCFVILDEAQNTTPEQMKMFLTRLGMNSKACICGDFTQIDLPKGIRSGLLDASEVLKDISEIKIIKLKTIDIVRNSLVKKIVDAYASHESTIKGGEI